MKTTLLFLKYLYHKIKKKIFKYRKYDNNHVCKKWKEFDIELTSVDGQGIIKEYLNNYRLTTRWQTL